MTQNIQTPRISRDNKAMREKSIEELRRIFDEQTNYIINLTDDYVILYDIQQKKLTLPDNYAEKRGIPTVFYNDKHLETDEIYFEGKYADSHRKFYENIKAGIPEDTIEAHVKFSNGTHFWERVHYHTIFDDEGKPCIAVISVYDTSTEHDFEQEGVFIDGQNKFLRAMMEHSKRVICYFNVKEKRLLIEKSMADYYGLKHEYINVPECFREIKLINEESWQRFEDIFRAISDGSALGKQYIYVYDKYGEPCWVEIKYTTYFDEANKADFAVMSFVDDTDDYEKELVFARYKSNMNNISKNHSWILEANLDKNTITKVRGNQPKDTRFIEKKPYQETIIAGIESRAYEDDCDMLKKMLDRENLMNCFKAGKAFQSCECRFNRGHRTYWYKISVQLISDPFLGDTRAAIIFSNVQMQKERELALWDKAMRDSATGLYNKASTENLIENEMEKNKTSAGTLIIIDIDNLKKINDNLGHAEGDKAIRLVSNIMKQHFRKSDILGRVGGDEFVAFLPDIEDSSLLIHSMKSLMEKFNNLRIGENQDVPMYVSVGLAGGLYSENKFSALYKHADQALYYIKNNGKNDFAFYDGK